MCQSCFGVSENVKNTKDIKKKPIYLFYQCTNFTKEEYDKELKYRNEQREIEGDKLDKLWGNENNMTETEYQELLKNLEYCYVPL